MSADRYEYVELQEEPARRSTWDEISRLRQEIAQLREEVEQLKTWADAATQ